MSADLERAYAKLAEKADKANIPSFLGVLGRARQRRRRTVSTWMSAVLVIALVGGAWVLLVPGTAPTASSSTRFVPLDLDAEPVVAFSGPITFALSMIDETRLYSTWLTEDSQQWVAVVDVATGKPLWDPVSLGPFGDTNGFDVADGVMLMFTEQGFGNPLIKNGEDTIIAIDVETGKILWVLPYSFGGTHRVLYPSTMIIASQDGSTISGMDLHTGIPKWTMPGSAPVVAMAEPFTSADYHDRYGQSGPRHSSASRFLVHLSSGMLEIRDIADGRLVKQLAGLAQARTGSFEYSSDFVMDNNLYRFDKSAISRFSLENGQPIWQVPVLGPGGPQRFMPCFVARLCLLYSDFLRVYDAATGAELWRQSVSGLSESFSTTPSHMAVSGGVWSSVFDEQGRDVLPEAAKQASLSWVDGENLLLRSPDGFVGLNLASGKEVTLGKPVLAEGVCASNSTMLACPTTNGISLWRYAVR